MVATKFQDKHITANGKQRASVFLDKLTTLWFNTGTLCNLECKNCYIESSPRNDQLSFISVDDVRLYLNEIRDYNLPTNLIGLTGGEPFLNPSIISILDLILSNQFNLLVLTNANLAISRHHRTLLELKQKYGNKLCLRVSLDHFTENVHDSERGKGAFTRTVEQFQWLHQNGFNLSIAGRSLLRETLTESMKGYERLLESKGVELDLENKLVIFPEMQTGREIPEITTECWEILDTSPNAQMCASERMIVKRKGESQPVVMPCTLLAYDDQFVLGKSLNSSQKEVYLNHRFCAEFCVLGGASCSKTK